MCNREKWKPVILCLCLWINALLPSSIWQWASLLSFPCQSWKFPLGGGRLCSFLIFQGRALFLGYTRGSSFKPHSPEASPLSHGFLWRMQLLVEVVEPLQILLIFQKSLRYGQVSSFPCPPTAYLLPPPPVWFPHCSASKIYLWVWGWGGKICPYTLPMCGTVSTRSLCAHLSQRDLLLQCSLHAPDAGSQPARLRSFQTVLLLDRF